MSALVAIALGLLARPGDLDEPIAIPSSPFLHAADTRGRASRVASYACDDAISEGGPEVVYRFDAPVAGTLRAWVEGDGGGVDVDAQLLDALAIDGGGRATACVARSNTIALGHVEPGPRYVVVDSFRDATRAGPYRLHVDFQPDDDWYARPIARGVVLKTKRYASLFGATQNGSVLEVDLREPGVVLRPISEGRCAVVSGLGARAGAVAAINGGFFGDACASLSLLKIDGRLISTNAVGRSAFGLDGAGQPMIAKIDRDRDWPAAVQAIGGVPRVASAGAIDVRTADEGAQPSFETARHPRTAVGYSGARAILATVDGRTSAGAGMTLPELAQWMIWLGAAEAVNLDGGGSTTLWVAGEPWGGVVSFPSDNGLADHEGERAVSNALGVFALPLDRPPLWLSAPPAGEVREGAPSVFELLAADPEGAPVAYATSLYGARTLARSDGSATLEWTPTWRDARSGARPFALYARDGSATATLTATLTVRLADADTDGLPDGFEAEYALDDPAADEDADGRTNLEEYLAGTDPTVSDAIPADAGLAALDAATGPGDASSGAPDAGAGAEDAGELDPPLVEARLEDAGCQATPGAPLFALVAVVLVLARRRGPALAALLLGGCLVDIDLSLLGGDGGPSPGADGASAADGGASGPCPGMVEVPTGCVDATEVTRGAYAAFLSARGGDTSGQGTRCRFNASFTPEAHWPPAPGTEALPVASIDWCDAAAFCASAGKRLCGAIGGGALPLARAADPGAAEWASVCSQGGALTFPYGASFSGAACRAGAAEPVAVRGSPGCEGGYPGVFDLSGNVAEWIDACDEGMGASGSNDDCAAIGGAFDGVEAELACASTRALRRSQSAPGVGFRCCASR